MATKTTPAPHLYALPPIPATIPSVLGPVPVTRAANLRNEKGEECLGIWRQVERDVRLEADAALTAAWQAYWHEWVHIALWDGSVELSDAEAERVCDVIAVARVREMLDGGGAHG